MQSQPYFSLSTFFPVLLLISFAFSPLNSVAQDEGNTEDSERGSSRLSLAAGHVYFQHPQEFKKTAVGALAFNFDYRLGQRWAAGLHSDVLFETRLESSSPPAESEYPLTARFISSYYPVKHLSFVFGLGDEITHHQNYILAALGADYGFRLKHGWELGAQLLYDLKFHSSNDCILSLAVGRVFSKRHH